MGNPVQQTMYLTPELWAPAYSVRLSATKYTPCLSGLIYVQRLLFLEYALPLRAYPYLGATDMITGSQSPLEEFQSLRDFGRVVARADAPAFLLRWSDDGETVFYGDKFHLTLKRFLLNLCGLLNAKGDIQKQLIEQAPFATLPLLIFKVLEISEPKILFLKYLKAELISRPGSSKTMDAILELFSLYETDPMVGEGKGDLVDLLDQQLRTDRLRSLTLPLDQLWWSDQVYMAAAAEKLADGSMDSRWRIPMGISGLLDAFLMIVATEGIHNSLMIHVLRLIGNTCADTDENRARVVAKGSLQVVMNLLKDKSLVPFVIPVLFNICFDYEPAQKQASNLHLSTALARFITDPGFEENRQFLRFTCKLLDMVLIQPDEPLLAPKGIVEALLSLAISARDLDEFIAVVSSATKYLQHTRFQVALCSSTTLHATLRLLLLSYTRYEENLDEADTLDEKENRRLCIWREDMSHVLSHISALPEFAASYLVNSAILLLLQNWLSSLRPQLQILACIMLGNLARSNEVCEGFVHKSGIHKPLMNILATATNSRVLYYALGCLTNLAIPPRNKTELGKAGLLGQLPHLWSVHTLPHIQSSAISLTRQLLIGNSPNVLRISAPLSNDPDSPATEKSGLSALISIFMRSNADLARMEIARALATVCQVLASDTSPYKINQTRRREVFERNRDIGVPLCFMLLQEKWPIVRSEGWFVLALLVHTDEGVQCVADIMHDMDVFILVMELITKKTFIERMTLPAVVKLAGMSPQQPEGETKEDETTRVDRENAIVLVSELLKRRASTMALLRRTEFENLFLDGGSLLRLRRPVVECDVGYITLSSVISADSKELATTNL
ncbi:hypothetical protein VE03_10305 [Pseudogymnoascus sp. 23342-1-I1]|nr:hypothetical protein VE03_10305 [Pseudogymnoascus sp. 23342-1-I1]